MDKIMTGKNSNDKSHLQIEEVYEYLRASVSDTKLVFSKVKHSKQCAACNKLFSDTEKLFTAVRLKTQEKPKNDLWPKIEMRHEFKRQEKRLRRKNWSFVSVAASLFIVIGFQWNMLNDDRSLQNKIQAVILQSQQLEQNLSLQSLRKTSYKSRLELSKKLQQIDEDLQLAYQENKKQAIILDLWNQRIDILQNRNTKVDSRLAVESI